MNIEACLSTGKDDWETPEDLFQVYNELFHFDLDAAANAANHRCGKWFGKGGLAEDALSVRWADYTEGPIWLNPPYSRVLQSQFVQKTILSGIKTVMLLPSRTDTKLFHEWILPECEVTFLKGRITFRGAPTGAPFPSLIAISGTYVEPRLE